MRDVISATSGTGATDAVPASSLQRLKARVARRPGRWRRRMARGRIRLDPLFESAVPESPAAAWETRCRIDRKDAELEVDQDAA